MIFERPHLYFVQYLKLVDVVIFYIYSTTVGYDM